MAILNKEFFQGENRYSEGDIELQILQRVKTTTKDQWEKDLESGLGWSHLYHLDPCRENLLSWYPFDPNGSLLEIGSGMGAITGLFCQKLREVQTIELSETRAQVAYERWKEFKNLTINVGSVSEVKLDKKFDYVTLIGVFEYSQAFLEGGPEEMLSLVKNYLAPGGKLIIAIENRMGLKYWAGYGEDHSGNLFESIEGYLPCDGQSRAPATTYGRAELKKLLSANGLGHFNFYYPHPDYKIPSAIYSDDHLPGPYDIASEEPNFDRERFGLFSTPRAWKGIIENELYPHFANSFLVFCEEA